jgi:hypothetical protein
MSLGENIRNGMKNIHAKFHECSFRWGGSNKIKFIFFWILVYFLWISKVSEWTSIKEWLTVTPFLTESFNHGTGHAALHDVVWRPLVQRRRQRWGRARRSSGAHCGDEAAAWPPEVEARQRSSVSPDRRPRRRARQGHRYSGCLRNLGALGLGRGARRRRQRQLGMAQCRSWRNCPARRGRRSRRLAGNALDGGFGGATPVTRWGGDRRPEWNR